MDVVKIGKSVVDRIAMDAEGTAMVRGVIALGNGLGLTPVAEGVEHDDQFVLLHELGCEALQGFLFGARHVLHEARRLCPLRAI
jgi:EAL domain-containing protein (putative c-di-GMP-specific phosphodiesterase class I)